MNNTEIRLVEAYRAADAMDAHAIQFALEDAGIDSEIDSEALQGSEYPLGWSTAPRILVEESLVLPAREIISQAQDRRGSDANPEPECCLACGQIMDKTETCPACGWTYQIDSHS